MLHAVLHNNEERVMKNVKSAMMLTALLILIAVTLPLIASTDAREMQIREAPLRSSALLQFADALLASVSSASLR